MNMQITHKHPVTNKAENITCYDVEQVDWGFYFFTDGELEAYKAAYIYRYSPGVKVVFAGGAQRWSVTVYNKLGAELFCK
jgi:hypothetical protein